MLKILTFRTKNTPVYWCDFYPIKQEYSLVGRKKFIGMKTDFIPINHIFIALARQIKKPKTYYGAIRNWQPRKTSAEAAICQQ